jgi:hypothetical protein
MLSVMVASLAAFTAYLAFNACVVTLLRLPMPEAACLIIMASYKVGGRALLVCRRPAAGQKAAQGCLRVRLCLPCLALTLPRAAAPSPAPQSAPVAITVISYITSDPQTQGLLAVPCVVGQLVQVFAGQPLAHYLRVRIKRWRRANPLLATAGCSPAAAAAALGVAAAGAAAAGCALDEDEGSADGVMVVVEGADAANRAKTGTATKAYSSG